MSNPDDRHYARLDPQPIDVIEAWGMTDDHYRATAFYYVARAPYKGSYSTDCIKAAWYLLRAAGWKLDMDAGSVTEMRGDAVEPESEAAPLKDGLPAGLRWAQDDVEIVRRHLAIPRDLSQGERDLLAIRRYISGVCHAVEMAAKVARTTGDEHSLMALGMIAGFFDEAAKDDDATLRLMAEMSDGTASPEPKAGA